MRVVHTSDWHAGRVWKGISRLGELEAVLDHLAGFVEHEAVDLLLVSGDVFDTSVPSAAAERAVFRFFRRVGSCGAHSVVIAGNHDSALRTEAWGELASLVHVHAVGRPRGPDQGGVVQLRARSGELGVVAALPFAAPRLLVEAVELARDDTAALRGYAEGMRRLIALLAQSFREDAVNLLCAHTHVEGALVAGSERGVHLGRQWEAHGQALPASAHYVALGHIHRPQQVAGGAQARYAGSALQLDFGEAGEQKSFVLLEAHPGEPVQLSLVPYQGGVPLALVRAPLDELEARADELRHAGWLKLVLPLTEPDADINRKVRRLLPNAVTVDVELPLAEPEPQAPRVSLVSHPPSEVFADYFRRQHGREPEPELLRLFEALQQQADRGPA